MLHFLRKCIFKQAAFNPVLDDRNTVLQLALVAKRVQRRYVFYYLTLSYVYDDIPLKGKTSPHSALGSLDMSFEVRLPSSLL